MTGGLVTVPAPTSDQREYVSDLIKWRDSSYTPDSVIGGPDDQPPTIPPHEPVVDPNPVIAKCGECGLELRPVLSARDVLMIVLKPYIYPAVCTRVVDGDTLDMVIDLGFRMTSTQRIRLMGYNAPEKTGRTFVFGGWATAQVVRHIEGAPLLIRTHKADSFGRYLADVAVFNPDGKSFDLVNRLVADGWGVRWDGKGKNPTPWITEEGALQYPYPNPPPTLNPR
jgi:endonuclease YncB( thermonuclease family)